MEIKYNIWHIDGYAGWATLKALNFNMLRSLN